MIKGLDNGYLYTKDNEKNIFPSAFSTEDKVVSNAIPIIIDGKQYYTGIGKSTVELDKTNLEITKVCTLTNLAMSNDKEFYLVVGLPVGQYKDQKDRFKEIVLSYNRCIIEYQNRTTQFNINDIIVFPQGVASLYSMDNLSTNALIFDISGRTVDIALIEMVNNKPILIKSDTWYKGMLVLYSTIIEAINKKFQLTLEARYAEQILFNGLYLYGQKQDISFLQPIIQEYLDEIFTTLFCFIWCFYDILYYI